MERNKEQWVRCPECGHKLFKIVNRNDGTFPFTIEAKCHSCKGINLIWIRPRPK